MKNEKTSGFRVRLLETYHALPYAAQARADMFSRKFFTDLRRLSRKGLSTTEIGEELQVSGKTIRKRLRNLVHPANDGTDS